MDIDTEYPKKGSVKITLGLEKSEEFCLYLRNPEWSRKTSVCVNGQSTAVNSGYIKLDNKWNDGDTIVLDLDMRARVICAPSDPKDVIIVDINWKYDYVTPRVVYESDDAKYHIALQRGPIVLARDARLGENVDTPVDILFDSEGTAELIPANSADFDTVEEYRVKQKDGSTFSVIDYSSAGKTWNEQSKYCCWFNTKK